MIDPSLGGTQREQSYSARVIRDVLSSLGAKLGLAWIILMIVCAVFAPMISNTHPYLVKEGGEFSSPFLEHLTWIDVALLVSFFAACTIWFSLKSIEGWKRLSLMILACLPLAS